MDPTGRYLDSGKEKLTDGWPGPSLGRDIVVFSFLMLSILTRLYGGLCSFYCCCAVIPSLADDGQVKHRLRAKMRSLSAQPRTKTRFLRKSIGEKNRFSWKSGQIVNWRAWIMYHLPLSSTQFWGGLSSFSFDRGLFQYA